MGNIIPFPNFPSFGWPM